MPEAKGAVSVLGKNIQHRGAEFTELHRDSLRPLRKIFAPLR